jgi:hypothetical protein
MLALLVLSLMTTAEGNKNKKEKHGQIYFILFLKCDKPMLLI